MGLDDDFCAPSAQASNGQPAVPEPDDNHWNTLQEILNAIGDLPGVMDRVEAYMRGRGIEDPQVEIAVLRNIAF